MSINNANPLFRNVCAIIDCLSVWCSECVYPAARTYLLYVWQQLYDECTYIRITFDVC